MSPRATLPPPQSATDLLLDALSEPFEHCRTADELHAAAERFDRQTEAIRDAFLSLTGAVDRVAATSIMVSIVKTLRDRSREMQSEASALRCSELGDDCRCARCRQLRAGRISVPA